MAASAQLALHSVLPVLLRPASWVTLHASSTDADLRGEPWPSEPTLSRPRVRRPPPPVSWGMTLADTFRDRRRTRLSEGRRRRELLSTADPSADPQFINAIAAADRFWGPDEKWRDALQSQRSGSTASAEPTIGSVEAAEVAAVEPAPVTIVRRGEVTRGSVGPGSPSTRFSATDGRPHRGRRVQHSVAGQTVAGGGPGQVMDHSLGADWGTPGVDRGSGLLVRRLHRIRSSGPVVNDQRR